MNETLEEFRQQLQQRVDLSEDDIRKLLNATASNIIEEMHNLEEDDILTILYYPTKDWKVGEKTFRTIKMSASVFPEYKGKILEFPDAPKTIEASNYLEYNDTLL